MRIGIIDLDTSHPGAWIPIEREMGHEIVGLFDSGDVHPAGYAQQFAAAQNIPRVYDSPQQMVADVDCVIIHSVDWDTHVAKAQPFVQAGKAVLVDKPIAGNARDLVTFGKWVGDGARITGGTALRFCAQIKTWLDQPLEKRGEADTVFCGCGVDELNYGIHGYATLTALLGTGAKTVQHLSKGGQRRLIVNYPNGTAGLLATGKTEHYLGFHATVVTDRAASHIIIDPNTLYRSLLENTLPYLSGQVALPPVPFDELIEPELIALAAQISWLENNRAVRLDEVWQSPYNYDGAAFAQTYRKQRYPDARDAS